jgi:serine phosphatase RsbU (regulator of sigma subunit)
MMSPLRKSVTHKFTALLLCIGALTVLTLSLLYAAGVSQIPTLYAGLLVVPMLFFAFVGFVWLITYPMGQLHQQVRNVMLGKKYERVAPAGYDEIAVNAHFFNEITKNIEALSDQIIAHKQFSTDINLASEIQRDILPRTAPPLPGLDIVAKSKAASSIGGDSFDFIPTDEHGTLIYIGDASGHGVAAGLIMTMVNTLIRTFSLQGLSPEEVIHHTNKMLHNRLSGKRFMSMAMLRWHPKQQRMHFTGAGHEHILVYRSQRKEVELIKTGGVALHLLPDISKIVQEQELKLGPRDVILLYTDGVTEAKNHYDEMFGVERLKTAFERNGHRASAEEIFDAVTTDFSEFVGSKQQEDDVTMMVLRRLHLEDKVRHGIKLDVNIQKHDGKRRDDIWSWV